MELKRLPIGAEDCEDFVREVEEDRHAFLDLLVRG